MEEIRIGGKAEIGYMGGQKWTGINSTNRYMSYGEINKIVKQAFRKKYPETKVSCSGKSFSGGQKCNGIVYMNLEDILVPYEDFLKSEYTPYWHGWYYINGRCVWGEDPSLTNEMRMKAIYESYVKRLKNYSGVRITTSVISESLDKCLLKPEAIERIEYLNALYDSYNSYDVNGMVDYFCVDFYKDVSIKAI